MSTDELLSLLGSGDPVSVQCHIIKVSVLHFNFNCFAISFVSLFRLAIADRCPIDSGIAFDRRILFQMFENIKSLRLETNLNGTIVIKGMISMEGEFLQFQNDGK